MFGLPSFQKLMVLVAVIGAVWFAFRMIGQLQKRRDEEQKLRQAKTERPAKGAATPPDDVEEMVKDPKTGAYVPKSSLDKD